MKLIGRVVSAKMKNTIVVEREITHMHPMYTKIIRSRRRLKAHTDIPLEVGDKVKIVQTRPVTKDTHFKVLEKI